MVFHLSLDSSLSQRRFTLAEVFVLFFCVFCSILWSWISHENYRSQNPCGEEMRNWIFVKVETSASGLFGWGECSLEWKTRSVCGAVEDYAPMIVGEDPTRIEHLYQKMYRQSFWRAGVIGLSAISGIEQACWDILGKSLGRPVYRNWEEAVRDRVRMYTHLGGGDMRAVYESQQSSDPQVFVDRALEVVSNGYTAVKVLLTPPTESLNSIADYKRAERTMEALRLAVGDEVDIIGVGGLSWPPLVGKRHPVLPYSGPVPSLLHRRTGASGECRCDGRSAAAKSSPHRHRGTSGDSTRVPASFREAGVQCNST